MRLLALACLLVSTAAAAEPRVAVIERSKFSERGGITRYHALRAQLDREKPSFRFVESPDGSKPSVPSFCEDANTSPDFKKICEELKRSDARQRADLAWRLHEAEVFAPLYAELDKAIASYAKTRGIELLLEKAELEIVYLAPGADITAAFIKDFNSRSAAPPKR